MNDTVYSIEQIKHIVSPVAEKHGVDKVFLFGSYARGNAKPSSDIDLLVNADHLQGMFALGGLYTDLEFALQKKLDLVTTNSLKYNRDKRFLDAIHKEQTLIYDNSVKSG